MKLRIETGQYQFAHGKNPRGRGYWWFEANTGETFQIDATYSEAKKAALAHFKNNPEVYSVKVCS